MKKFVLLTEVIRPVYNAPAQNDQKLTFRALALGASGQLATKPSRHQERYTEVVCGRFANVSERDVDETTRKRNDRSLGKTTDSKV